MAINFYEDLSVYNHVVVEGGFYAGTAVDTNYDLKIKGASLLQSTLAVSGIVTLSSVANASSDPDKFLCISGSNQVEYRTGAQVLSDIGAASSSSLSNYLPLAGGTMTGSIRLNDSVQLQIGSSNDAYITHNGSNTYFVNGVGNLEITNDTNDGDIIFKSDDGSGGTTTYFKLDGSIADGTYRYTKWDDYSVISLGTGNDFQLFHDSTKSRVENLTGNLEITQKADNADIIFNCDDGSGGVTEYFRVDGGAERNIFSKSLRLLDDVKLDIGSSDDFRIIHTSANNASFIQNFTGDLQIQNNSDGDDILFRCDDGSGGLTTYFYLDGGQTNVNFQKDALFADNKKALFGGSGDLQIYHNGSNSIIEDTGTGDLVVKFSNDLLIEGQDGANLINCNEGNSVQLYYNGSEKLETKSTGIEVTGDVLDRDIPCLLTSHFSDDNSTTSYLFMPFNNNSESSSNQYYNYFAAPAAGKVVSIMLMHVSGSMSSSFTTQLRVAKNGSTANTSGELTPSNGTNDGSYVEYEPGTVFAKGDRLQFSYQKSAGSKYWRGATATIVIELTDYDI